MKGAFYLFPDFSSYYGTEVEGFGVIDCSEALCRFFLEKAQVCVIVNIYLFFFLFIIVQRPFRVDTII
jgi:aspartate/methionine/tyrosine aminotransferase